MSIMTAVGIGVSLLGAAQSASAAKKAERLALEGGALSQAASYANAADAEALGALNAAAITGAAENNAAMTLEMGYANAQAITDATLHNVKMYAIQSNETIKQHVREERWMAGDIRAVLSGSGVMVNGGSPMAYLQATVKAGIQERDFMQRRDALTMIGMAEDGLRQSMLTRKEADLSASVMRSNAALQAQVTIAEATAQANAMRRQGDISKQVGVANAQAAYYGGMSNAIGAIGSAARYAGSAYSSWKASSASTPSYNFAGSSYSQGVAAGTYTYGNPHAG